MKAHMNIEQSYHRFLGSMNSNVDNTKKSTCVRGEACLCANAIQEIATRLLHANDHVAIATNIDTTSTHRMVVGCGH